MNVAASPQSFARLKVAPLTPSIGAEISGIDLSQEQDDAVIAEIRAALLANEVLDLEIAGRAGSFCSRP